MGILKDISWKKVLIVSGGIALYYYFRNKKFDEVQTTINNTVPKSNPLAPAQVPSFSTLKNLF